MNRSNRLIVKTSLEEIGATIKLVGKPLTRKMYLDARKWYIFHKERVLSLGFSRKIEKFPRKHKLKKIEEEI